MPCTGRSPTAGEQAHEKRLNNQTIRIRVPKYP